MDGIAIDARGEAEWERRLAAALGERARVRYGRSRSRVVQARWERGTLHLRLHEIFRVAPEPVAEDLVSWLRSGRRARRACARLDAWIDARLAELPPLAARRPRLRSTGEHHDLAELAEDLLETRFARAAPGPSLAPDERPGLTWGRRGRRRVRHTLRLGSFEPERRIVRVHAVLDQPAVPEWFVRYLLFHELLHAALPASVGPGGRQLHHGPEFRRWERRYPDYERALRWQERWIGTLIRSAREDRPVPRTKWGAMRGEPGRRRPRPDREEQQGPRQLLLF